MSIQIREQPFDPWREVAAYQSNLGRMGEYGATAVFVGTMRDFNEGEHVTAMTLDYYPGMTESHLAQICVYARQEWALLDALIVHRVGDIEPGEPIVLVAAWSAHRAAAFEASRFMMEDLKSKAPFWKKESLQGHERWVEKNTSG